MVSQSLLIQDTIVVAVGTGHGRNFPYLHISLAANGGTLGDFVRGVEEIMRLISPSP